MEHDKRKVYRRTSGYLESVFAGIKERGLLDWSTIARDEIHQRRGRGSGCLKRRWTGIKVELCRRHRKNTCFITIPSPLLTLLYDMKGGKLQHFILESRELQILIIPCNSTAFFLKAIDLAFGKLSLSTHCSAARRLASVRSAILCVKLKH